MGWMYICRGWIQGRWIWGGGWVNIGAVAGECTPISRKNALGDRRSTGGRYASYCNAFLSSLSIDLLESYHTGSHILLSYLQNEVCQDLLSTKSILDHIFPPWTRIYKWFCLQNWRVDVISYVSGSQTWRCYRSLVLVQRFKPEGGCWIKDLVFHFT